MEFLNLHSEYLTPGDLGGGLQTETLLSPFNEEYLHHGVHIFCTDGDSALFNIETGNEMLKKNGFDGHEFTTLETNGLLAFRESFHRRYDRGRPTLDQVLQFGDILDRHLTSGARETIAALNDLNIPVHLISGGVLQMLDQVADNIGIPAANIHAIPLSFNAEGKYSGFDETHMLLDDTGKARTVEKIVDAQDLRWSIVGDGNGDMLAARDSRTVKKGLIIAFAGYARRNWIEQAPIVIECPDYAPVLPLVVGVERWPILLNHSTHKVALLRGLGYIISGQVRFRSDYMPYYEAVKKFIAENHLENEIISSMEGTDIC